MSSWFRLDCMHTHVPCTHSDTLTFNAVLHIGRNYTKSEFYIYICIYIHLLSSLIFCLRSSAQQPSQRHRVLYVSWCWLSSVFHTPFFLSAFKVFSSGAAELILLQLSFATSCPPQCNNCTFIHLQSPFQFLRGFYDLQEFWLWAVSGLHAQSVPWGHKGSFRGEHWASWS